MSYLLVLIHLVNIFDDNHFGNSNEVRFVCVNIYYALFMLIMIDVKLTPSGFDRLPVCMNV